MFKPTLFLLAIVVGLVASVPVMEEPKMEKLDQSALLLQSALLVPEVERLTNKSIILEDMPKVEKLVATEMSAKTDIEDVKLMKLENQIDTLSEKALKLEEEIKSDNLELQRKEIDMLDESVQFRKLEASFLVDEIKTEKLVENIVTHLNKTQTEIIMDETFNKTIKAALLKEDLPLEERVKIIGTTFNKTERSDILIEETKLVNLKREMDLTKEKVVRMDKDIKEKKAITDKLIEQINKNELKFNNLLNKLNSTEVKSEKLEEVKEAETEKLISEIVENGEETTTVAALKLKEDKEDEELEVDMAHEENHARGVRSILDKITLFFQEKEQGVIDFISISYCKTNKKFEYYKSHPTDATKYVECNPWGKGTIKSCPEGRLWDQFHELCSAPDVLKIGQNLTHEFMALEKLEKTMSGLNCNNSEFKCMNGGECKLVEEKYVCVCTKKYSGEICEHKIVKNSIFSEIISDKFNFTLFKSELADVAGEKSLTTKDHHNMKKFLKESTHMEIMNYQSLFPEGEVRYDIVMNSLIEAILEDIYPDAYYLSVFNSTQHTLVNVVRTIPSLISYSKYSSQRYTEVFFKYQEVLDKLYKSLNGTWSNVQTEAREYIKISGHILNETHILDNLVRTANKTTLLDVNSKLNKEYNMTVEASMKFNLELEAMRLNFIQDMKLNPELVNKKLSELIDREEVRRLISVFDEVAIRSAQIINSLFSYGFWFVTDLFAEHF